MPRPGIALIKYGNFDQELTDTLHDDIAGALDRAGLNAGQILLLGYAIRSGGHDRIEPTRDPGLQIEPWPL